MGEDTMFNIYTYMYKYTLIYIETPFLRQGVYIIYIIYILYYINSTYIIHIYNMNCLSSMSAPKKAAK